MSAPAYKRAAYVRGCENKNCYSRALASGRLAAVLWVLVLLLVSCPRNFLGLLLVHGAGWESRRIHRALRSSACAGPLPGLGGPICNASRRARRHSHGRDLRGHAPVHEAHCSNSKDCNGKARAAKSNASSVRRSSGGGSCCCRVGRRRKGDAGGGVRRRAVDASTKGLRVAAAGRRH